MEKTKEELRIQQKRAEIGEQERDRKLEQQEKELKELREKIDKMGEDSGSNAIREMDEREGKSNNISEGKDREGTARKTTIWRQLRRYWTTLK